MRRKEAGMTEDQINWLLFLATIVVIVGIWKLFDR